MNRYDPIDRWIAKFPRDKQLILMWLRLILYVGFLVMAFRGCS